MASRKITSEIRTPMLILRRSRVLFKHVSRQEHRNISTLSDEPSLYQCKEHDKETTSRQAARWRPPVYTRRSGRARSMEATVPITVESYAAGRHYFHRLFSAFSNTLFRYFRLFGLPVIDLQFSSLADSFYLKHLSGLATSHPILRS